MNKERMTIKDTLPLVGFPGGMKSYLRFLRRARILVNENVSLEKYIEEDYFFYADVSKAKYNGQVVTKKQLFVQQRGVDLLKSIVKRRMSWIIDNIAKNGFYK